jgi:hypothetical protein
MWYKQNKKFVHWEDNECNIDCIYNKIQWLNCEIKEILIGSSTYKKEVDAECRWEPKIPDRIVWKYQRKWKSDTAELNDWEETKKCYSNELKYSIKYLVISKN